MTGLRLHQSNRMEVLAAELARLMHTDPGEPFAPERIVVPYPTIGRWLSLELSRQLGIAANLRFQPPAEFAWWIMRGVVPELSEERPYTPARLRWRIHDLLSGPAGEPREGAARGSPASGSPDASESGRAARAWQGALGGYLRDGDPRKRLELADRLARMYDQCLLYRPDWIREWERGAAPHWQAKLWQRLAGMDGPDAAGHWVVALDRFREKFRTEYRAGVAGGVAAARSSAPSPHARSFAPSTPPHSPALPPLADGSPRPPGWPRRASFFAVPALSPSYLELLCEAAHGIEIHLFLLNPCREYWGDIHSRREIDYRTGGADPEARYFTEGNELLAAWGRAGRDMIDALVEVAGAEWEDHFVPPAGAGRLAAVQRDILDLRLAGEAVHADGALAAAPAGRGGDAEAQTGPSHRTAPQTVPDAGPPPATDDSIRIHVCHSPVREAEVLHDRLLALFDAHRDLEPADILVLTPDLEVYGTAIEAVFGAAGRIPCNVARTRGGESCTLRAFLDLLALPRSRHGAEPMLAPLAAPAVRARFGIGESDLPAVRVLVREAGIRWGVDEAHRGDEGLPETSGHTWRQGLSRLLLGYAMEGTDALVAGLVPCSPGAAGFGAGEVDGGLLGRFVSYCEGVFGLRRRLAGERRPARWAAELRAVVRDFLSDGSGPAHGAGGAGGIDGAGRAGGAGGASATGRIHRAIGRPFAGELGDEVGAVRALIRDFEREAEQAESPVPFEVVLDVLRERAGDTSREPARLADGVTVASLGAGRIFPAGIVCVAGMNDGTFPRLDPAPSFDLVAAGPARRGDRDVRHEGRFAFLEALLAARRCFLVTYTGRGPRDDAPIPPSVLVDELKDYLARRFPGVAVETRHPLQPFSPRYFLPPAAAETPGGGPRDGEDLFSYSLGMCEAAKAMQGGGKDAGARGRFAVALSEPEESRRCVALAELVAFFANPARFFLRDRLGARLEAGDAALDEEEPFEIEGLEHYRLRSEIWEQVRAGAAPDRTAALLQGSGRLPHAGLGLVVHERGREEAEQLGRRLARYRAALEAPPREIDFELGGFRIAGAIEHVGPEGGEPGRSGAGGAGLSRTGPEAAGSGETRSKESEPREAASVANGPVRMVWWRIGRLRARDRIEIGLRQLAWAAAGHEPAGAVAISLERGSWTSADFSPPDPDLAGEQLERWLRAWWRGLTSPLPFFPEASFAYAKAVARAGDDGNGVVETARAKAHDAWFGNRYRRGERLDPYLGLVHDGPDPLTGEFEALAEALLVPFIAGAGR